MRKYWDKRDGITGSANIASEAGYAVSQGARGDCTLHAPTAIPDPARVFPDLLRISEVHIRPATVLAPMAGVTDTVFRRFIKQLGGCGLIMTEFTSADGMLRDQRVRGRYLHFYEDEHPISAQLFGSNPAVLADAARMVEDLGFDLVDLNLGCPAKKVVKCNGGSGLLRDLPLIEKIFRSVRAAVKIPFTVKFRAGWNDEEIVCVELARMAEDCGLNAVALHARTRQQGYSGTARWEWIARVKQAVRIPVIGNGDIRSPEDACAMVAQTGCDAVMIGRTAPSNPWIFRQIEQYVGRQSSVVGRQESAISHQPSAIIGQSSAIRHQLSPVSHQPLASDFIEDENREGHDFSRADKSAPSGSALAAEGVGGMGVIPSGAKAPVSSAVDGTAEAVPFPFVARPENEPGGMLYDIPTEADRYQMIRTYFQMLLEEGMPGAEGKMKQFASWFTHGVPGGAALRKAIYEAKSGTVILASVEEFFEARLLGAACK